MASAPSPALSPLSPGARAYLCVTAAIGGGAIMIIEIMGTKMLAPYVGLSHFVWTAQIAVTLLALSAGYYFGGRLATSRRALPWLLAAYAVAGVYLLGAVAFCANVAYAFLNLDLAMAALLTSSALFFVPLFLLAMTGPVLVHALTQAMATVGPMVGRLAAFGTVGSLIGTLLAGYVLPRAPNSFVMSLLAALLVLTAAVYFFGSFRTAAARTTTTVGLAAALLLARAVVHGDHWKGPAGAELFRSNSFFGLIQVVQSPDARKRFVFNDNVMHDGCDAATNESLFAYSYLVEGLSRINSPRPDNVLCIGLGSGVLPMAFARTGSAVDVVEINPVMLSIAQAWFGLDPEKVHVTIDDGRTFLNRSGQAYDVILVDAFVGSSAPSHLYTREAFTAMKARLKPGGTLTFNVLGALVGDGNFFTASLSRTLSTVFKHVQVHAGTTEFTNEVFVASDRPPPTTDDTASVKVHPACIAEVRAVMAAGPRPVDATRGRVLTDDFNPTDLYDAKNREAEQRAQALRMRGT